MLYCHLQHHNDTINKHRHRKTSLEKYLYLSLYCKGSKRFTQGLCVRGSWRPNRNCNILTPLLRPSALCLSCFPDAQPEAQRLTLLGDGFLYCILSAFSLDPNSSGPQAPSAWCGLPTTSRLAPSPTLTGTGTSVLTELYNSSTPTHSPTWSLKSHVWSSSSGNNCHAVHRSLSSGASVYECTMGIFFTSSHFISQFPPTRFPLITAIRMCHLLLVHHLGMAFLVGSKAKIQQQNINDYSAENWLHIY